MSPPLTVWQQKSHKRVWNENLELLMRSAVCLLSAVCLFISNKPLGELETLKLLKAEMFGMTIRIFDVVSCLFIFSYLFTFLKKVT